MDSTYYNIPSRLVVRGWKERTPEDFKFTLKFPKIITHDKKLDDVSKYLYSFFYALEPLIDKTLALLIQLPPYLSANRGFSSLQNMVTKLDKRFKYALEVREPTWFDDVVYDFLKEKNISFVWSVRNELKTPPLLTSNQIYIRFIGDRSINEKNFGKIIKNRYDEMTEYVKNIKNKIEKNNGSIHQIIVAFNNHFAGFGPQSANDFLKLMDKPQVDWKSGLVLDDSNFSTDKSQTTMSDFTGFSHLVK